ncbi:forkhead box protein R1 [Menidia menidia]
MTLQLRTRAGLSGLHCSVGLTDWDMDKELRLATTTDQFWHEEKLNDQYVVQRPCARASRRKDEFIWYDKTSDTFVKPNLWLLVNPHIACPITYRERAPGPRPARDPARAQEPAERPAPPPPDAAPPERLHLSGLPSAAKQLQMTQMAIKTEAGPCRPNKSRRQGRTTKILEAVKPGCWPRPPVNYCILIALALKSSHSGSLKVQQIYNFTREHFPFFQTAPDGWKNTIRHNLCFNSSFRKTCNQLCRDGKRKSCFWHLTLDGHRRLRAELHTLAGETLKQLERSMSQPGKCPRRSRVPMLALWVCDSN